MIDKEHGGVAVSLVSATTQMPAIDVITTQSDGKAHALQSHHQCQQVLRQPSEVLAAIYAELLAAPPS